MSTYDNHTLYVMLPTWRWVGLLTLRMYYVLEVGGRLILCECCVMSACVKRKVWT